MTYQQVIALFIICALVIVLFVYAYWLGRQKGFVQGQLAGDLKHEATKQELEASLQFWRNDHRNLAQLAKKLRDTQALQSHHRVIMLQIAENLRIAAETWSAFKTGKKLERDAHRLRTDALAIADLLKPADQEAAA